MKRFLTSFENAFVGIIETLAKGGNIFVHLFIAGVAIAFGALLEISQVEWCLIVICIGMVISAEVINTAIEFLVDALYPYRNEKARKVKDAAAGGVLVVAVAAFVVGMFIFLPKII